jgi:hypothetical protein
MTTMEAPAGICLCGAAHCNTAEALAYRARLKVREGNEREINALAFAAYCADLDSGLPLQSTEAYFLAAWDLVLGNVPHP